MPRKNNGGKSDGLIALNLEISGKSCILNQQQLFLVSNPCVLWNDDKSVNLYIDRFDVRALIGSYGEFSRRKKKLNNFNDDIKESNELAFERYQDIFAEPQTQPVTDPYYPNNHDNTGKNVYSNVKFDYHSNRAEIWEKPTREPYEVSNYLDTSHCVLPMTKKQYDLMLHTVKNIRESNVQLELLLKVKHGDKNIMFDFLNHDCDLYPLFTLLKSLSEEMFWNVFLNKTKPPVKQSSTETLVVNNDSPNVTCDSNKNSSDSVNNALSLLGSMYDSDNSDDDNDNEVVVQEREPEAATGVVIASTSGVVKEGIVGQSAVDQRVADQGVVKQQKGEEVQCITAITIRPSDLLETLEDRECTCDESTEQQSNRAPETNACEWNRALESVAAPFSSSSGASSVDIVSEVPTHKKSRFCDVSRERGADSAVCQSAVVGTAVFDSAASLTLHIAAAAPTTLEVTVQPEVDISLLPVSVDNILLKLEQLEKCIGCHEGIDPLNPSEVFTSLPECSADSDFSDDQLDSDCDERLVWGQPHCEKKRRVATLVKAQRLQRARDMKAHFSSKVSSVSLSTSSSSGSLSGDLADSTATTTATAKVASGVSKLDVSMPKKAKYNNCGYSYST